MATRIVPVTPASKTAPAIALPDQAETPAGTSTSFDGFPDDATLEMVYDSLVFQRGVQAFLSALPMAALNVQRRAFRKFGPSNGTVFIFETVPDSCSPFLAPNTESIYVLSWLDLKEGPVVVESPPNTLGIVDDRRFHYLADASGARSENSSGGMFLFLPPGYSGQVGDGYHVFESRTFGNLFATRGFLVTGGPEAGAEAIKRHLRVYPLSKANDPPATRFVNVAAKTFHTTHSTDYTFFQEVQEVVQEEPGAALDEETLALLAAIGIERGKAFAPDVRMKKILSDAAAVGNATARALAHRPLLEEAYYYPDSAWCTPLLGGSRLFERNGARLLDARFFFFFYATGIAPAQPSRMVGVGSQYAAAFTDSNGQALEGGRAYAVHLPPDIPARDFWSLSVYDNQTRAPLPQSSQRAPGISSQRKGLAINPDGSVDVYFGPEPISGTESNWIHTSPGRSWNVILRLFGPLQPFFDKTWRPGEIEVIDRRLWSGPET